MAVLADLGRIPSVSFTKDIDYIKSVYMQKEFQRLRTEQEVIEEKIDPEYLKRYEEERRQLISDVGLRTDVLDVDRESIMNDILAKMEKSRASHRTKTKMNLDSDIPEFFGYDGQSRVLSAETPKNNRVKKFLGARRKEERKILEDLNPFVFSLDQEE